MVVTDKRSVVKAYLRGEKDVKTANKSLSTRDGKTLYSYNTPLVYHDSKKGTYYLNKDKYSTTTSSQQNTFRQEARGRPFMEVSESELREKINK